MPWKRRRAGESERPLAPALRRPSNPTSVAKAMAPPERPRSPGRPTRGKKKRGRGDAPGPLPASVTMSVLSVLHGEAAAELGDAGLRWGVLYRFVVRDADHQPIAAGAYTIRRHLIHVSSSGAFEADEKGARISVVSLDAGAEGFDFVGVEELSAPERHRAGGVRSARAPRVVKEASSEGADSVVEYFSFELGGVTYAIPQSGFVLQRTRRGQRLEIARAPRATGSVHGAVVGGLVQDGAGDTFVLGLR
ncbi:MAG: hypothetical protein R3B70_26935 [Polyangiaceae bacterium]